MNESVHSKLFYENIAFAKADSNKNGKIDDDEKSVFEKEIKKFDTNNDGIIDTQDYIINKESMLITDEERKLMKQYDDYVKNNPMNEQNESKRIELLENWNPMVGLQKSIKYDNFTNDIIKLINYWKDTGASDKIANWSNAIKKWFDGTSAK